MIPEIVSVYLLHIAKIGFRKIMSKDVISKPRLMVVVQIVWNQRS